MDHEASSADVVADAEAPARIGRYRVLRALGAGGMGVVYAAYDDELARAVAVKLVRRSGAGEQARARMRREAQAMARLSHANVVQIHDVGEHAGELFLTMELIRGETLGAWLAELGPPRARARRWREVVAVFVAAGRGLAAAHAAGLVHRDFKPANVLVGAGVVKVGDFGLARGERDVEAATEVDGAGSSALGERMTETGALLGTRAYLAPELLAGRASSAASDQFAFCVALWEALVGRRPFAGDDMRTLAANLLAGRREAAPAGFVPAPAWLMAVIDRGLAREPEARWPGMDALLAALQDDPAVRRRRRIALVGVTVALVGGLIGGAISEARRRGECVALGAALAWDAASRGRVAGVFAGVDAPDAAATWERVAPRLDAWAQAWSAARTAACEEADPERAQRRAACLEHARWEFEAVIDVFAAANRTTVIEAASAVAELPAVGRCDDPTWLAADVSLRAGGAGEGVALRRDLARVPALVRAGRHAEALALAQRAVATARAASDEAAQAEALARLGGVQWNMADFAAAERSLLAGHFLAGRVAHDLVAYATARDLAWVVGVRLARPGEGRVWLELARTSLARGGEDPAAEPDLFERAGEIAFAEGRLAEALAAHTRALELRERRFGGEHPAIAESLLALGVVHAALGDELDLATLERARVVAEAALGPAHPTVATVDNEIGRALFARGRGEESVAALRRALAVRERALGADEPGLANILASLAAALQARGELLESLLLLERSVQILERALGPDHPDTLGARGTLANTLAESGRVAEGVAMLRDVAAAGERALGPEAPLVTVTLANLAYYLAEQGEHAAALPLRRRVLASDEARLGPTHLEVADDLVAVAHACVAVGEPAEALALARRSLEIREATLPAGDPARARGQEAVALALLALDRVDEATAIAGSADLAALRARLARLRGR